MKLIKPKFPPARNTALLPSAPQKLRKQVPKANLYSVPGKRGILGLLTYKTQYFGTPIILPSLCQSNGVSFQQTTSQPGLLDGKAFTPKEPTRMGLKSSLEKEKKKKPRLELAFQAVGKDRWRG